VNEQQKADHELVWEYSGGTVTPRPECHAPATADCRIEWVCRMRDIGNHRPRG
jgi:hypothetical protein